MINLLISLKQTKTVMGRAPSSEHSLLISSFNFLTILVTDKSFDE